MLYKMIALNVEIPPYNGIIMLAILSTLLFIFFITYLVKVKGKTPATPATPAPTNNVAPKKITPATPKQGQGEIIAAITAALMQLQMAPTTGMTEDQRAAAFAEVGFVIRSIRRV